jgi:hypothetical protein
MPAIGGEHSGESVVPRGISRTRESGKPRIASGGHSGFQGARGDGDWPRQNLYLTRGAVMKSLKEATTLVIGPPLAVAAAAAAAIALVLNLFGVRALERLARR